MYLPPTKKNLNIICDGTNKKWDHTRGVMPYLILEHHSGHFGWLPSAGCHPALHAPSRAIISHRPPSGLGACHSFFVGGPDNLVYTQVRATSGTDNIPPDPATRHHQRVPLIIKGGGAHGSSLSPAFRQPQNPPTPYAGARHHQRGVPTTIK